MLEDCPKITVRGVSFDHCAGPVLYASLPCSTEIFKGHRTNRSADKHRLVSILLDHLAAMGDPLWECFHSWSGDPFPVRLVHSPLGRPHLLRGEYRGPAVSFSESGGTLWAALCGDRSDIGIDVAGADEFQKGYPIHRVFNEQELQHALRLADGELESAAALLWSIKEAVVKALGCAFHLAAPLEINVYPSVAGGDGGYSFPVRISRKARMRFSTDAGRSILVRSFPRANTWFSITLLKRQP